MPTGTVPLVLILVGVLAFLALGMLVMYAKFYRQVDQGKALIINTRGEDPIVTFTGTMVLPIIHRAEYMDISVKTIEIDRRGKEGLICKDNIRADIKVTFFVQVNKTQDDVRTVARTIGCVRASNPETLEQLFAAKFSEALKTVGKRLNFEDLYKERQKFKDDILDVIGKDLSGFVLADAAIDYLEQTPVELLDKDNIMDAEGIRKITELTVLQNVQTNELRQKERMEIGSQNLNSDEAIFRFEQRRAEAEAKKAKEIAVAQAREQNEAARILSDERKKTLLLQEKNDEEALVAREARERGVQVAQKNKEREVAVENERVVKARELEIVSRERDVSLQQIAREKELEVQKKDIADVIRARIAVEKTVAEEEERIKDVRAVAEATRLKDVVRINAEAEAQEQLVKQIKNAEASEEAAKFRAREKLITADAELEASDKAARAKIRIAEGVQAESAAEGLARIRVKEADAQAIEKQGFAEARVTLEKMQAAASGEEKQGLARVIVKEAEAQAIEKQGRAEALVAKERLLAEATGIEQKGLAEARTREAEAIALEKRGLAEATAIKQRLLAEAAGTAEKAAAMKALDGVGREHEEFRLRLEKERAVELESLRIRADVARAQAEVLRGAFEHAKINIVGGDGAFFDRFIKAVTLGQSVDGMVDQSATVRSLVGDYLNGNASLPNDLKQLVTQPSPLGRPSDATLSGLLKSLLPSADDDGKKKIQALADRARELGLDELAHRSQQA
ncbi:hypothetical protein [Sorangium cellulosum]|uniref:hypothetical protein n=1 Tax=Sorangium cellulosum TaxID=56 RepID=UPI000CF49575|nr:hypothetical protein [Sorangium cellulosum]